MNKYESTDKIIKIPMNNKGDGSPNNIPENIKYHDTSLLQPEHANLWSSEIDLVSGKMREVVIYTIVVQSQ